jgi:hypothetical protein
VELRELAVLPGVVIGKLYVGGPKLALAGRLGIAAHCVLPCAFCLGEFDNVSGCARWPELDDGVHGNQTGNVNPGGFDCTGGSETVFRSGSSVRRNPAAEDVIPEWMLI